MTSAKRAAGASDGEPVQRRERRYLTFIDDQGPAIMDESVLPASRSQSRKSTNSVDKFKSSISFADLAVSRTASRSPTRSPVLSRSNTGLAVGPSSSLLLPPPMTSSPKASPPTTARLEALRRDRRFRTTGYEDAGGIAENQSICQQSCCGMRSRSNTLESLTNWTSSKELPPAVAAGSETVAASDDSSYGFPTLQAAGWKCVDAKFLSAPEGVLEDEKMQFRLACQVLGILHVQKEGTSEERMMLSFRKLKIPASVDEIKQLVEKLRKLDHVNVVRLVEACEDSTELHLIYEGVDGLGKLHLQVCTRELALDIREATLLMQQMMAAVSYCSKPQINVYQLEWSPWHIMSTSYDSVLPVKVFGVGLAAHVLAPPPVSQKGQDPELLLKGAFHYLPPELCRSRMDPAEKYPFKRLPVAARWSADVWSIGALYHLALTAHPPCGGATEMAVLTRTLEQRHGFALDAPMLEPAGLDLLERMLAPSLGARPKPLTVMMDSFVLKTVRTRDHREQLVKVQDRLRTFSESCQVMRVLGSLVLHHLSPGRKRMLEDLFHIMDTNGDGELQVSEVGPENSSAVKEIFDRLDRDKSCSVSIGEFFVANMFAEEVLTERMLVRTFDSLDQDGSGQISALELLHVLKKFEPNLSAEAIIEFLGKVDRDWDADIDFGEFRSFFPYVHVRSDALRSRSTMSVQLRELLSQVFDEYEHDVQKWLENISMMSDQAADVRPIVFKDGEEKAFAVRLSSCAKKVQMLVKDLPAPKLTQKQIHTMRKCTNPNTQDQGGGPLGITQMVKGMRPAWMKDLGELTLLARDLHQYGRSKERRRSDALHCIEFIQELCKTIVTSVSMAIIEQGSTLEATDVEPPLQTLPVTRRGLTNTGKEEDGEGAELIRRYKVLRERHEKEQRAQAATEGAGEKVAGSSALQRAATFAHRRSQRRKTSLRAPMPQ